MKTFALSLLSVSMLTAAHTHLTPDHTIRDLLAHPALAGFGRLLLPSDGRASDDRMRLRNIGSLLPYHSHVDPPTVVSALNHMIDDVNSGQTVFYDLYTDEEKKQQPAKSHTGLFFFRGKPGAPFAVIAPGGGFAYVASVHEGFPYAVAISQQGYNAFVLRYRVGNGGADATRDLAAAISYVFRNAKTLRVSTDSYSLWGSSAGARMAAAIGSYVLENNPVNAAPCPAGQKCTGLDVKEFRRSARVVAVTDARLDQYAHLRKSGRGIHVEVEAAICAEHLEKRRVQEDVLGFETFEQCSHCCDDLRACCFDSIPHAAGELEAVQSHDCASAKHRLVAGGSWTLGR